VGKVRKTVCFSTSGKIIILKMTFAMCDDDLQQNGESSTKKQKSEATPCD
jgi:hypothetical protein